MAKCSAAARLFSTTISRLSKAPPAASSIRSGPGLKDFIGTSPGSPQRLLTRTPEPHPYIDPESLRGDGKKVFLDVHGCQMNVSDAEVVRAVLEGQGYALTMNAAEADVWSIVTCSIRESAEDKIWSKLRHIQRKRKAKVYRPSLRVALLGCMAERLKEKLLTGDDRLVDVVAGPDAYRDLPRLLAASAFADNDDSTINVVLSLEETYADILPSRLNAESVSGFVSIQRGCDNMCSYCIVPFTRGRERSRPVESILAEVQHLADSGVRDVTLLGQNVNSYRFVSEDSVKAFGGLDAGEGTRVTPGFNSIYRVFQQMCSTETGV